MKKPVIVISPQTHEVKGLPFEMKMYATPEKNAWQLQQRGAIPVMPSFLSEEEAEQLAISGGAQIIRLPATEKLKFQQAVEPLYEKYCGSHMELLNEIIQSRNE